MRQNSFLKRIDEIRANSVTPKEFKKVWGTSLEEYKAKMADYLENQLGLYDEENKENTHPAEGSPRTAAVETAAAKGSAVNADLTDKDDNSYCLEDAKTKVFISTTPNKISIKQSIKDELRKMLLKMEIYLLKWDFEQHFLVDMGSRTLDIEPRKYLSKKRKKMLEDITVTLWNKKFKDLICPATDNRIEPKEVPLKKKIWNVTFSEISEDEDLEFSGRAKELQSKEVDTVRIIETPGLDGEYNEVKANGKDQLSFNKNGSNSLDFILMALNPESEKKLAAAIQMIARSFVDVDDDKSIIAKKSMRGIKLQIMPAEEKKKFSGLQGFHLIPSKDTKSLARSTKLPNLSKSLFPKESIILLDLKEYNGGKVKEKDQQSPNKNDSISWDFKLIALNTESEKKLAAAIQMIARSFGDVDDDNSVMEINSMRDVKLQIMPAKEGKTMSEIRQLINGLKYVASSMDLPHPSKSLLSEKNTLLINIGRSGFENVFALKSEKRSEKESARKGKKVGS